MTSPEYDLGLYIHIPFCPQQCDFCVFDTHPRDDALMNAYLTALGCEMDGYGNEFRPLSPVVTTLYFGGGTPSLLSPGDLLRLFDQIKRNFKLGPDCEISLEAHPATLTTQKLQGYFEAGINRLSLGVQSYSDRDLSTLKRPYVNRTVAALLAQARDIGYQNVSCDLMFGLPGQSLASWEKSLDEILDLSPDHLSLYALTVEAGTPLDAAVKGGRVRISGEEIQAVMYDLAWSKVSERGFESYEISNFGKPGKECRHNQRYWQRSDYLGLGCSAHSSIGSERFSNLKTPGAYRRAVETEGNARTEIEILSNPSRLTEALVFGLRQPSGISLKDLSERFLTPFPDGLLDTLHRLTREGFLSFSKERNPGEETRIRLTRKGIHLSDEISLTLLAQSGHD